MVRSFEGYALTTAEILYHLPDHPHLVQTYVWQQYDVAPKFPALQQFLDFWNKNIEGKLHSVQVAQAARGRDKLRYANVSLAIH
jgi:uncharacterized protein Usg